MSIKVMTLVWLYFPHGSSLLLLMLALADWADDQGKGIYPCNATIAEKLRLDIRQTQRLMKKLMDCGFIGKDGFSEQGTNRVKILLPNLLNRPRSYLKDHDKYKSMVEEYLMLASPTGDNNDGNSDIDVTHEVSCVTQNVTHESPNTLTPSSKSSTPPPPAGVVTLDDYRVPDCLVNYPSDVIQLLDMAKEEDRQSILDKVEIQVVGGIKGERSEIKDPVGFPGALCKASRNGQYRDKQEARNKPDENEVRLRELRLEYNEKINCLDTLNRLLTHDVENPLLLVQVEQVQEDINILLQQIAELEK